MSGANYWYCEVCDQKALYDDSDDERQDIVVMHTSCMWADRKEREAVLRRRIADEIKTFAKEAAKTDSPDAILGLLSAARIAAGEKYTSLDALADDLDEALAAGSEATS